jgi:hypothetical protein
MDVLRSPPVSLPNLYQRCANRLRAVAAAHAAVALLVEHERLRRRKERWKANAEMRCAAGASFLTTPPVVTASSVRHFL